MKVKHLFLFILFQRTITGKIFNDAEDPAYSRSAFFETKETKRLYGHVLKRFESPSLISCTRSCIETDWCSSTNFKASSKDEDNGTCELNEHSIVDENTGFNDEEGVTFSMPIKVICYEPFSAACISLSTCDNCQLLPVYCKLNKSVISTICDICVKGGKCQ